jgi:mono/diheme cytochrome c family protein
MSETLNPSTATTPATAEPKALRRAVPVWLLVLLFLLLYWGMVYFDERSGWGNAQVYLPYKSLDDLLPYEPRFEGPDLQRGKVLFETYCGLCHNNDGTGKPNQAPPFVGSEWVLGSPNRMIRIPQNGLQGPIPLKGQTWNQAPSMAAMGAALSDEDLALILTYIRQSWGNKAPEITPAQVKAVRAEVSSRTQPWTAEQLLAFP